MIRHLTAAQRFQEKYSVTEGGCWTWSASINGPHPKTGLSYGRFYAGPGRYVLAHRWSYEFHVGAIPDGLDVDHLCRNTLCVNPDHLEAVTRRTNVLRGVSPNAVNGRKTHCINGHPLKGANLYKNSDTRQCVTCAREYARRTRRRNAEALRKAIREVGG